MTALAFAPNGVQKSSLSNVIEEWFTNDSIKRGGLRNPATNVIEHDDKFIIELAVPGCSKDTFDITVQRNQLQINTRSSGQETIEQEGYSLREFSRSSFSKTFNLSSAILVDDITAKCEHGVLEVHLPKKCLDPTK